ncbi:MAG: MATE family efflux transporter [Oscillospiraceae bacterium]|nr:MATE family efflux transporter [Oscillospiraceae bacterium]
MEEIRKENKMGVMPVGKLLFNVSLPLMFSMLVQALYNVVDSIFVGMVSPAAFKAVSLAFPVQSLIIAVSVGTGVGLNSLLSRRLGEKKNEEASRAAVNGLFLAVCSWAVFALFGAFGSGWYIGLFDKDPAVLEMGTQYLFIVTVFSIGCFVEIACERIMQSTGNTMYNLLMQGTGAVINIILDPILIFGLFGLPKMGVAGAAAATVTGQLIAMVLGLWLNLRKNKEITLKLRGFRPSGRLIKEIYIVGAPSIVMQSIMGIMTMGLNKVLGPFSEHAVSVINAYFKLNSFIFMPLFGLTNGMVPIIAYNYGARRKHRMLKTYRIAMVTSVGMMAAGTLLFQLAPSWLLEIFSAPADMLAVGVPALRIISLSFIVSGLAIVTSTLFQAVGNGTFSLIISVVRQLVVILPVSFVLACLFGINAAWWAFVVSELVALALCLPMYRSIKKRLIDPLPDEPVVDGANELKK